MPPSPPKGSPVPLNPLVPRFNPKGLSNILNREVSYHMQGWVPHWKFCGSGANVTPFRSGANVTLCQGRMWPPSLKVHDLWEVFATDLRSVRKVWCKKSGPTLCTTTGDTMRPCKDLHDSRAFEHFAIRVLDRLNLWSGSLWRRSGHLRQWRLSQSMSWLSEDILDEILEGFWRSLFDSTWDWHVMCLATFLWRTRCNVDTIFVKFQDRYVLVSLHALAHHFWLTGFELRCCGVAAL